ncbi:hypothetical protein ACFQH6_03520 [Halobacteriaceae archaeon GCM10025711]
MSGDIEDLRQQFEDLEARVAELENKVASGKVEQASSGLREFYDKADPSTHVERAVVIGHYLEKYGGGGQFHQ